ncbi:hypothetical protein [Azospirillum argentinense]|uniref:hypothetical protein n=1 Tax=Azospirillum argentinense TaxID=2970906 RepID=UPI0011F1F486|nr:hypothetical protein [Azospirillum argentinense]
MSDIQDDETLRFRIRGGQGDEYTVAFTLRQGEAASICTCMAGRMGRFCKHRVALLDGDVSDLLSDNADDVVRLRRLIEGTELERAHQQLGRAGARDGYQALEQATKEATLLRKEVRVAADIAGTGIKAGMIGKVVASQTPETGRGTSFTHLAPTAHLVRFTKERLEQWRDALPVAPGHLPVGAEIWLREDEIEPLGEG